MLLTIFSSVVLLLLGTGVLLYVRNSRSAGGREAANLRLLATHSADMLSLHDPVSLVFNYASPACLALGGYQPENLRGQPLQDIVHPNDWPALLVYRDSLQQNADAPALQWRLLRNDAGWVWVESTGKIITAFNGNREILWVTRNVDARLQAEFALRESERRLRMINAQISDVVWVFDVERKSYSYVSPSVQRMLGYLPADLQGHDSSAWMNPESSAQFQARLEERLEWHAHNGDEQEPVCMEFEGKKADGGRIWLECRSTLARSTSGRLEVTGVMRDITVRKKTEETLRSREMELQENNRIFMALLDVVQTRVFWKDRQGRYLGCNRAFAEDAGYSSAQELLGKNDLEIGWHGNAQDVVDRDRLVLENGLVESGDVTEIPTRDGSLRYVLSHRSPLRDGEGNISGLLGTYSDITPLVLAERSLRESERRFRLMVDQQADLIVKMDLDGRFVYASPSFCELYDAPLDELLGRSFLPRLGSADRTTAEEALRRVQFPPHVVTFEQRNQVGERSHWISWSVRGVPDEENGRVRLLVGVGRDITEQKGLTEQREKLLRQMESKNIELERIANLVTHDVKSALFNMAGFAQELKNDLGQGCIAEVNEDAEQIIRAGDRLGRLLEAEIRLSRIGHNFAGRWFDLGRLVGQVLRDRRREFESAQMEVLLQTSVQQAWGDEEKVATALHCLLDNAIKFRGAHVRHTLLVAVERSLGPTGAFEACVEVHDNGLGIRPDFLPQMFELFNKQDPQSTGLGEGLATVRRIAELHGGRTWAKSEGPGQGVAVFFTLPEPDSAS